jgi:hypothetical protein
MCDLFLNLSHLHKCRELRHFINKRNTLFKEKYLRLKTKPHKKPHT